MKLFINFVSILSMYKILVLRTLQQILFIGDAFNPPAVCLPYHRELLIFNQIIPC